MTPESYNLLTEDDKNELGLLIARAGLVLTNVCSAELGQTHATFTAYKDDEDGRMTESTHKVRVER